MYWVPDLKIHFFVFHPSFSWSASFWWPVVHLYPIAVVVTRLFFVCRIIWSFISNFFSLKVNSAVAISCFKSFTRFERFLNSSSYASRFWATINHSWVWGLRFRSEVAESVILYWWPLQWFCTIFFSNWNLLIVSLNSIFCWDKLSPVSCSSCYIDTILQLRAFNYSSKFRIVVCFCWSDC